MKRTIVEQANWAIMDVTGQSPEGPVEMKVIQITDPVSSEVFEFPLVREQAKEIGEALGRTPEEAAKFAAGQTARERLDVVSRLPDALRNNRGGSPR